MARELIITNPPATTMNVRRGTVDASYRADVSDRSERPPGVVAGVSKVEAVAKYNNAEDDEDAATMLRRRRSRKIAMKISSTPPVTSSSLTRPQDLGLEPRYKSVAVSDRSHSQSSAQTSNNQPTRILPPTLNEFIKFIANRSRRNQTKVTMVSRRRCGSGGREWKVVEFIFVDMIMVLEQAPLS